MTTSFAGGNDNTDGNIDGNTNDTEKFFFLFLDNFGKSIAEASKFNDKCKKISMFQDCCTTSDEAFGIFTIERCWDTWTKEMVQGKDKIQKNDSIYVQRYANKKYAGWNSNGLKRFSVIANEVSIARSTNKRKNLEEKYRIEKRGNKEQEVNKLSNVSASETFEPNTIFVPYNDLPKDMASMMPTMNQFDMMDDDDMTVDNDDNNLTAETKDVVYHNLDTTDLSEEENEDDEDEDGNDSEDDSEDDFEDDNDSNVGLNQTQNEQSMHSPLDVAFHTSTNSPPDMNPSPYLLDQLKY